MIAIQAFGQFVVGGNYPISITVFPFLIVNHRSAGSPRRRAEIGKEAFAGAMDGATPFTWRDAKTSILFMVINIIQDLAIIATRYLQ